MILTTALFRSSRHRVLRPVELQLDSAFRRNTCTQSWAFRKRTQPASVAVRFPTEALDAVGETIRTRGNEFGSTTGRPRRCGWFDGPAARYASMINGLDSIAITKIDVLDAFAEIPICVEYKYKGSVLKEFPADCAILAKIEPVYKNLKGWQTSACGSERMVGAPGCGAGLSEVSLRLSRREDQHGLDGAVTG